MHTTPNTPRPQTWADWEATVRRLAQNARDEGVKLYRDPEDGRYYASSVSEPHRLHYLTGVSCDCAGFVHHGHCKHHSALLVALGWVPDDGPDPEPVSPLLCCPECNGTGEVDWGMVPSIGGLGGYQMETRPCWRCDGTGEVSPPSERQAA